MLRKLDLLERLENPWDNPERSSCPPFCLQAGLHVSLIRNTTVICDFLVFRDYFYNNLWKFCQCLIIPSASFLNVRPKLFDLIALWLGPALWSLDRSSFISFWQYSAVFSLPCVSITEVNVYISVILIVVKSGVK